MIHVVEICVRYMITLMFCKCGGTALGFKLFIGRYVLLCCFILLLIKLRHGNKPSSFMVLVHVNILKLSMYISHIIIICLELIAAI